MENISIYLVQVCRGEHDDEHFFTIFATDDESYAKKWRDKFNRIIEENKDRIQKYYDDGNYEKPELFWQDMIEWDTPMAMIEKAEGRFDNYTTEIIQQEYDWEGTIDIVECCEIGPIIDEKYCPECGRRIIR